MKLNRWALALIIIFLFFGAQSLVHDYPPPPSAEIIKPLPVPPLFLSCPIEGMCSELHVSKD